VLDELANPLNVLHVGLAARDGLEVVGIEQPRLEVVPSSTLRSIPFQSRSASKLRVVVPKLRVSWERRPCSLGTRTHAVMDSLCTSSPAQRSMIRSIVSLPSRGWRCVVRRSLIAENLSFVLVATVGGA
jgi:hypothetical protein